MPKENLFYQVGHDAEVSDVDAAIVEGVRQGLAVHGRRRVVATLPEESRNLDVQEEVGRVLDEAALLLEEVAFRVQVLHAGGEHVRVKPVKETSLLFIHCGHWCYGNIVRV